MFQKHRFIRVLNNVFLKLKLFQLLRLVKINYTETMNELFQLLRYNGTKIKSKSNKNPNPQIHFKLADNQFFAQVCIHTKQNINNAIFFTTVNKILAH